MGILKRQKDEIQSKEENIATVKEKRVKDL